jgi:hypothetical protein
VAGSQRRTPLPQITLTPLCVLAYVQRHAPRHREGERSVLAASWRGVQRSRVTRWCATKQDVQDCGCGTSPLAVLMLMC